MAVYKAATPAGTWARAEWLELRVVLAVPVLVFVLLVPLMLLTRSTDTRVCTYGITPADAEVFVADLRRRIGSGAQSPR